MVQSVLIRGETPCREAHGRHRGRPVGLALAIASIVLSAAPARAEAPAELPAQPAAAEARLAYQGRTETDRLRSLDCLAQAIYCLLYTSPSPRDGLLSRMPSSA